VKRPSAGWSLALVLAVACVAFVHVGGIKRPADTDDELPTIVYVRNKILQEWVEEPDADRRARMRYGAVEGMTAQLDPYSEFIPPEKKDRFDEDTNGEFGGLGVLIQMDHGQVVIEAPLEGTPAWDAGVLPGDRVLEIDGKRYEFQNRDEATAHLRGKLGTEVELLVENEKRPSRVRLRIKRAIIKMQSVVGTRIVREKQDEKVGYLRITSFQEPTTEEFDRAIGQLTSAGLSALVIDLRGNPGGILNKATEIASRVLDRDMTVVITRGRDKNEIKTTAFAPAEAPRLRMPIAILLNNESASASEVLAGALRDNKRATLVGSRSFGKGSVQSLLPIDDGKAKLKLTTHYYFSPSGRRIHRVEDATEKDEWGLLPDIAVPLDASTHKELLRQQYELELEELRLKRDPSAKPTDPTKLVRDPQLDAAVEHLVRVLEHEATLAPDKPVTLPPDVATINTLGAPRHGPSGAGGG
jgi:carboxyl-terminal processing protease